MSTIQVPQFHAVLTMLGFAKELINFNSPTDKENLEAFIQKWIEADSFRETEPRKFLQLFGDGLALFIKLPEYIKNAENSGKSIFGTAIYSALGWAGWVAQKNQIRVTFTETGAVFN